MVSMVYRCQVCDRTGAAVAKSGLKDAGYLSEINTKHTIRKNKLRRERGRYREEISGK